MACALISPSYFDPELKRRFCSIIAQLRIGNPKLETKNENVRFQHFFRLKYDDIAFSLKGNCWESNMPLLNGCSLELRLQSL